jgi:hypothetical protein
MNFVWTFRVGVEHLLIIEIRCAAFAWDEVK